MKRLVFTLLVFVGILAMAAVSSAQIWHTANQSTVAWDAVTTLSDGSAIPASDVVKYEVFIKNAVTGGEPVSLGEAAVLEYTVTLNIEGSYFVGVSAKRYDEGGNLLNESTVAWSDVPENCEGEVAFGVRYFLPPSTVGGLRHQ